MDKLQMFRSIIVLKTENYKENFDFLPSVIKERSESEHLYHSLYSSLSSEQVKILEQWVEAEAIINDSFYHFMYIQGFIDAAVPNITKLIMEHGIEKLL